MLFSEHIHIFLCYVLIKRHIWNALMHFADMSRSLRCEMEDIYTNKTHCRSVCLSVRPNILRLELERHETQQVGPLGTGECLHPNGFLNFELKVLFWPKV